MKKLIFYNCLFLFYPTDDKMKLWTLWSVLKLKDDSESEQFHFPLEDSPHQDCSYIRSKRYNYQ